MKYNRKTRQSYKRVKPKSKMTKTKKPKQSRPRPHPKPRPKPRLPKVVATEPTRTIPQVKQVEPEKIESVAEIKVEKPSKEEMKLIAPSEEEKEAAKLLPVPTQGPIPTIVDWDNIPLSAMPPKTSAYYDYPHPGAPKGILPLLREMFKRNRMDQDVCPVNVLLMGTKGTGKTVSVRKFAEEANLPYWYIQGENVPVWALLGRTEIKDGKTRFIEGIIPRAVKSGGILHFDEPNVIDPEVLMRLDELLDDRRQLNMERYTGDIIKAHPDLFIIFSMNPPTYEGVKDLPEPIKSRLGKVVEMEPPSVELEMRTVKEKFHLSDSELKVTPSGVTSGSMAKDLKDFLSIINRLRKQAELSYIPTMRETYSFVQDLLHGDSFEEAFEHAVLARYYNPEEKAKIKEALKGEDRI